MEKEVLSVASILRQKAEKLLKSRTLKKIASEGEILKLLHELEVYGVELEMQNEELLIANEEMSSKKYQLSEQSKQELIHELEVNQLELEMQNEELVLSNVVSRDVAERYSDLFNFSSSGYLILSKGGEILDLNFAGAILLGKDRFDLKNSQFGFHVSDEDKHFYNDFLTDIFTNKLKITCEVSLIPSLSRTSIVQLTGILTQNEEQCLMTVLDITERVQTKKYRDLNREVLQILNEPDDIQVTINRVLDIMKKRTGFDAVGIRIEELNDLPYLYQSGFACDFMLNKKSLIKKDRKRKAGRYEEGTFQLACSCGLVISKQDDLSNSNTPVGSWWTNDSFGKLGSSDEEDIQNKSRNHCIHGYASVALVPIHNSGKIVGVIQFNDYRSGVFNANKIELLEGIATHIGTALMRKQAKETLRKNEALLRSITENAPDIIVQLDRSGSILYINRAMPGFSIEECIGKNFCEWTLPEYHDQMKRSLDLVYSEVKTQSYLTRGNDAVERLRWYRTSISPVEKKGNVKNAIVIIRDVTDHLHREELLSKSEAKRNAILQTAMDGFWIFDRKGKLLEVNDTYCKMSGYTKKELLGMQIQDIVVVKSEEEMASLFEKIIKIGEDRFEGQHRCKDGSIIDVEMSVQYRSENGGQYVKFVHDITERKKKEKELFESNEQFRLLFETSGEGIMLTQPDGSVYSANPAACKMFGRSEEEIIKLARNGISDLNDPRLPGALEERKRTGHFKGELNYLRNDGTPFPVEISSIIFQDSKGKERTSTFFRDISERKQIEKALFENNNTLKLAMEAGNMAWWEMDIPTGNVIFVKSKTEMLGYPPDNFKNYRDFMALVHPEDNERCINAMRDHYTGLKDKYTVEYRILSQSGDYVWCSDIGSITKRDAKGNPLIITGLAFNIDGRKKAEEELLTNNARLTLAMQVSNMAWWEMNIATGAISFEKRKAEMLGYDAKDFKHYEDFMKLVHPEDAERAMDAMRQHMYGSADKYEVEYRILAKSGEYKWFYDLGSITERDSTGKAILATGLVTNITERKHIEEALRESEEKVRFKLQSILSPEGNINDLELNDIIDVPSIQILMDNFYELSQIPMAIIDTKGKVLVSVGWQDICTKFHRVFPGSCTNCIESDVHLTQGITEGEFVMYKCKNNMWDMATPLIIGGEHKGNLFMGQFFFESEAIEYNVFRKQAVQYGFPEQEYMDSLNKAPRLNKQKLEFAKAFFMNFSKTITQLSYGNIKLARAITQQQQIENELREKDELLNRSHEIAHLGSWSFDHVNSRLIWSDEIYRIFGFQKQEFPATYDRFLEAVHPDDRDSVHQAWTSSILEGKNGYEIEHRVVRNESGEIRYVHEKCEHIKDVSGKIIRSVGMVHDITERKESLDALQKSQEELEVALASMTDAVAITDINGRFIHINDAFVSYYKFQNKEECFKSFAEFPEKIEVVMVDGTPSPMDMWAIPRALRGEKATNAEYKLRRKDTGETWTGSYSFSPIRNKEGNIAGAVMVGRDITESKKQEEELRISKQTLEAVFNSVTETIMMFDFNGQILAVNKTASQRWGVPDKELIGQNWIALTSAKIRETRQAQIQDMILSGLPVRFEEDRDGIIYDMTLYPIKDTSGKIEQYVLFSSDVTEKKRVAEALRISEEQYSLIYNSSRDSIFSMDMKDNFTGANRSFCKELKLDVNNIIGHSEEEVGLPENVFQKVEKLKKEVVESNDAVISEIKIPISDGSVRYFELIINPLHDSNGKMIGYGGSARNISNRKNIENALKESEKRFRYLVKDMPVGVILYGESSEVIMSNPKALELLGIKEDQLLGKTPIEPKWNIINEDGNKLHKRDRPLPLAFSSNHSVHDLVIGVCRPVTTDIIWLLMNAEVILKEDKSIRNVVSSFIDITERKEKEESLRKLNQILSALSKSSQAMAQLLDEADYLEQVCKIVVENTDFAMVWIGFAENDVEKSIRPMANAGFNDHYLESIKLSWDDTEFGCGPTGVAIRTGKMSICNNMRTDPCFEPWHEQALKRGYASSIVFPLISGDKTFGAISIYSNKPDSFIDDEIRLLSKLASDLSLGITTIRLRAAHKLAEEALVKSHIELEERVMDRTNDLFKLNEDLKVTEEKYRTVANFATNWEFWIAPSDQMIYCSPSCERISGYTSTEFAVNSQLISDIVYPDDLHIFKSHKKTEQLAHVCDHEVQYRILRKDGAIRWIGHFCQPIFDESGSFKGIRGSNKDITARKKMEELLTTSNQKYKMLSENIIDGIFICKNGRFEYANKAIYDIFGYNGRELENMKLTQLVTIDYHDELENILFTDDIHNQSCSIEVECLKKDLSTVFIEILLNYVSKDKIVYGVIHDITEKKLLQKNMVKAIIQTEEKERAHFSKELHDGLGPLLSTIKLYLQWSERPNINKSREEIIGKAGEILEEALTTVKEISNKLSPHLLISYGLNSAIKSFVDKLNATKKYSIFFDSNSTRRIDVEIEAALYRAIIECINNTLKYAKAENITIKLEDNGSQIMMQYKDDGLGFDISNAMGQHKGLGLFNLQNRIQTIGGKVVLHSEPGKGVDYVFTVNI